VGVQTPNVVRESQTKLALTRNEAAEAIGQSVVTVDRLTKRGLLRPSRATRRPVYPVGELERFLRETSASLVGLAVSGRATRARHAGHAYRATSKVAVPNLSSPSQSQEGGNEPSCRASSAELETVRPIPPREAGGLLPADSLDVGPLSRTAEEDGGAS
jgi:hypothetical protein